MKRLFPLALVAAALCLAGCEKSQTAELPPAPYDESIDGVVIILPQPDPNILTGTASPTVSAPAPQQAPATALSETAPAEPAPAAPVDGTPAPGTGDWGAPAPSAPAGSTPAAPAPATPAAPAPATPAAPAPATPAPAPGGGAPGGTWNSGPSQTDLPPTVTEMTGVPL